MNGDLLFSGTRGPWVPPGASLYFDFTAGQGYSGSFVGASELLTTTRASGAYAPNAAGVYSLFSSNQPRITDLGLLVEESRTNSIRNNSMQGAVAGTPGTLPTNWEASFLVAGGTSTRTISLATVQGIDFIFAALGGTPAAATYATGFDATTQIAASTGQVWTGSVFVQKTAGDFTGFSAYTIVLREYDSGGSFLRQTTTDISGVGSAVARYTVSATLGVSTAYVQLAVRYTATGAAIGLTIGFGWPQLELGAFATSPIRTTSAAATRAADAISMALPVASPTEGTLFTQGSIPFAAAAGAQMAFASLSDGTANERIPSAYQVTGNIYLSAVVDGGVAQSSITFAAPSMGTRIKLAHAFKANDFRAAMNGSLGTPDVGGTMPNVTTLYLGARSPGASYLNGWLERVALFPTANANAQLTAITT